MVQGKKSRFGESRTPGEEEEKGRKSSPRKTAARPRQKSRRKVSQLITITRQGSNLKVGTNSRGTEIKISLDLGGGSHSCSKKGRPSKKPETMKESSS